VCPLAAEAQSPQPVTPPGADSTTVVIRSQHRRLPFGQDIQRLAVGDTDVLTAELINSREVLVLGRETGRTTLIVWFVGGGSREYIMSVQLDLSVLQNALRRIHPSIEVESAPDRDALVLTGTVPTLVLSLTAETLARNYLDAGNTRRAQPLIASPVPAAPGVAPPGVAGPPPGQAQTSTPGAGNQAPGVQLQGVAPLPSGTVINLIQLETLPPLPEQKIAEAIQALGGQAVTIRRILRGNVRDDAEDTLVLEGRVPNQVALVRVLTVAAELFTRQTITADDIEVVADEAGALAQSRQSQTMSQGFFLGGGGVGSTLFGGSRGTRLTNEVTRNFARAKAIKAAGGRILSFIEVTDLPQVRVGVQLLEVNRTKLQSYNPDWTVLISNFDQPSLSPPPQAIAIQGAQAARVGGAGISAVQAVLSFLAGGFLGRLQYSGDHAAVDAAVLLLEREGIARSLSSPSLAVLSGELAQVQIGGEVPVPIAFAPGFGVTVGGGGTTAGTTGGVFSAVEFVPFGVQLQIRPLVGDDDTITLDVQPTVVTPDALLTTAIRETTGTTVPTTAFQTRALRTSSRLQDGEVLLLGGLVSNNTSSNLGSTPGLRDVPILGQLFQSQTKSDDTRELVIVVNPVVLRKPVPDAALWTFDGRDELMGRVIEKLFSATSSSESATSSSESVTPPR
jgi:Flp pilus assembly secretin CpaC